ncbi:MAG: LytTR family DNA-binding domain-containing protein [Eubacterium sp.]|jgi:DNA-binding LytR/AlgR family response regulator|nr:LytTR family DNA-binding domain-containing protein [Eubacterium sp.]
MLNIAFVDDDIEFLHLFKTMIMEEFKKINISVKIEVFNDGKQLLKAHKFKLYDVIFLDICMPKMDGFEIAEQIRSLSAYTYIIFITANEDMVYDSFDFQPFHFIKKGAEDFVRKRLSSILLKFSRHFKQNNKLVLRLSQYDQKVVFYKDIYYIQSGKNYIYYHHTNSEIYKVRGKLSDIVSDMREYDFIKIHSRIMVNMRYISKIDFTNEIVYTTFNKTLYMSKANKEAVNKDYLTYMRFKK